MRVVVDATKLLQFMERYKARIANDLDRYMIRVCNNYRNLARSNLYGGHGYKTGQLSRSINFKVSGNKFHRLTGIIGPIGVGGVEAAGVPQAGPQNRPPGLPYWIEKGHTIKSGPGRSILRWWEGYHYMELGYAAGNLFAESSWGDLIESWRSTLRGA